MPRPVHFEIHATDPARIGAGPHRPPRNATSAAVTGADGTIALDRHAIAGVGWLAYFKDADGNLFGPMQPDDKAK